MKLKCNDGITRNFTLSHYCVIANWCVIANLQDARCDECGEIFGEYLAREEMKSEFRKHVCKSTDKRSVMITWRPKIGKFENGRSGSIGKIKIFSIDWDSSQHLSNKNWLLICFLPSLEQFREHFSEIDGACAGAEKILLAWLKDTGLESEYQK